MSSTPKALLTVAGLLSCALPAVLQAQQEASQAKIFNTVKQKLAAGKQVVGGTVYLADPDAYCAMATSGFDFLWIEMQHSTLTYQEVARMVAHCKGAPAMPFVRVPDATEGDIQKAVDLGAVGIIVPMVDDIEKIKNAIKYAMYPPRGKRSQGGGQYRALWGNAYREQANDNIMIVAMIESPLGVDIAEKMAAVEGVDVIFAASTDLSSFSGLKQGDSKYEALVKRIHDATLKHGKKLAGPLAWKDRPDFTFFQGPGEAQLIAAGAKQALGSPTAATGPQRGVAPTEGSEK